MIIAKQAVTIDVISDENPPFIVSINSNDVYFVDKMPVTFEQLEDQLKSAAAKTRNLILDINGDENAHLGTLVKVHDAAAEAGIKSLIILTKQPQKPDVN